MNRCLINLIYDICDYVEENIHVLKWHDFFLKKTEKKKKEKMKFPHYFKLPQLHFSPLAFPLTAETAMQFRHCPSTDGATTKPYTTINMVPMH